MHMEKDGMRLRSLPDLSRLYGQWFESGGRTFFSFSIDEVYRWLFFSMCVECPSAMLEG